MDNSDTESVEQTRWTRPLIRKLISLLRKSENENIYNTKHPNYANRRKRTETIRKMLMELREVDACVTMDGLRTKIRGIRAQYVTEFRRIEAIRKSGGVDEMCAPTMWFFEEMKPLHSFFNTKLPESTNQNNESKKSPIREELEDVESTETIKRRKKITFTRPIFRKLINLLRENEIMYNVNHPDYHNKKKRSDVLQKMCTELRKMNESVTVEAIKVKIWGLRKQYLEEQRRLKSLKSNNVEFPRLWCYDQLDFLKDQFKDVTDTASASDRDGDSDSSLEEVFIEFGEAIESYPIKANTNTTELCRLCANLTNMSNLENLFEENHKQLLEQIEELIGLQLRNTAKISKYICKTCEDQTLHAHQFRQHCIESQKRFASMEYSNQKENLNNAENLNIASDEEDGAVYEYELVEDDDELMVPFHEVLLKEEDKEDIEENEEDNEDISLDNNSYESLMDEETETSYVKIEVKRLNESETTYETEEPKRIIETSKNLTSQLKPIPNKNARIKLKKKLPLICDQCGKHFKHKSGLNVHVRRHLGVKEFQCDHCPKAFFIKSEMQLHRRIHTGETPYPCGYCELRFKSCTKRVLHERQYHTNDKPFACDQCDRRFTSSSAFKCHRMRHTGIRPYECAVCNFSFLEAKHLRVHCRSTTHKKNEEKKQYMENQNKTPSEEQYVILEEHLI